MDGKTLSQWLDLLIQEYGLADVLDMLRIQISDTPKLKVLSLKLEEAVSLAAEAEQGGLGGFPHEPLLQEAEAEAKS
jgi:hypothetical protein